MKGGLIYLVEGATEKKLVETLKTELLCIKPGRVNILNVVQRKVSPVLFSTLHGLVNVAVIFDTDNDGEHLVNYPRL